jgi:hypothetical protein
MSTINVAKCAGESAYPQYWKDLEACWFPSLGFSGPTLIDYSNKLRRNLSFGVDSSWSNRTVLNSGYNSFNVLPTFSVLSTPFSFIIRCYCTRDAVYNMIFSTSAYNGLYIVKSGGLFYLINSPSIRDTTALTLNRWYTLGVVYYNKPTSPTRSVLMNQYYINGILSSEVMSGAIGTISKLLTDGISTNYFGGYFDYAALYKRPLSSQEMLFLHNSPEKIFEKKHYYRYFSAPPAPVPHINSPLQFDFVRPLIVKKQYNKCSIWSLKRQT